MDSEKDKKVKRIARFLELGGTMLAEHCKTCGAPKFRYQGRVICPLCDVREEGEVEEERTESKVEERTESKVEEKVEEEAEETKEVPESPAETQAPLQKTQVSAPGAGIPAGQAPGQASGKEPWFARKQGVPESRAPLKSSEPTETGGVRADLAPKVEEMSVEEKPSAGVSEGAGQDAPAQVRKTVGETLPEREAVPLKKDMRKAGPAPLPEAYFESGRSRKELEALLFRKLAGIADSLQEEMDPRRIDEDFNLIEKGLTLIERLKNI